MSERSRWVSALAGGGLLVAGLSAPLPEIEPLTQRAVGLALFAAVVWTVQPVPIEYSSLIILMLLPAMDLLSFQESFTPFARQTIWLVFAGMTLSMAITRSGLGGRLALLVLRHTGTSTLRIIATLNLLGLLLAFLVPSGGVRILFLMPIGLAVADRLREAGEDSGMADVVVTLSLLCSTYYGGCGVLTGSVPNLVVAGQLEAAGRLVYWGEWLQWMFPVIGLARTCLCFAVIWLLFGRRMVSRVSRPGGDSKPSSPAAPLNLTEHRTLLLLLAGVGLWSTDIYHGLAPVYVGLILVLVAFLPRWGVLPIGQLKEINFPFFFYLAALFSVGEALQQSGFNDCFMGWVEGVIDLDQYGWMARHLAITFLVVPLDFLMDIAAVAGVMTPAMLDFGQTHGMAQLPTALSVAMATAIVVLPTRQRPS